MLVDLSEEEIRVVKIALGLKECEWIESKKIILFDQAIVLDRVNSKLEIAIRTEKSKNFKSA